MDLATGASCTWAERKKQKIGEHGKCDEAHSTGVFEDGPVLKKRKIGGRPGPHLKSPGLTRKRKSNIENMCIMQRLKMWGLDKEFTVRGGSRLECITCMKYGAWGEQEGADCHMKEKKKKEKKQVVKKKKKKDPLLMHEGHTGEVKSPRKSHGPVEAESDSSDDETLSKHQLQSHALQKGMYEPPQAAHRLKYILKRHLSGPCHKKAAGAREEWQDGRVNDQDVPTAAQMRFVYEDVKKSPMVLPSPHCLGDTL